MFFKLFGRLSSNWPLVVNRSLGWRSISSRQLEYAEYGEPLQVIKLVDRKVAKLNTVQVRYSLIASPINPADINTLQGVYPVKPPLPAVGGMEGAVRIEEVGAKVIGLQVGDLAIPRSDSLGMWRTVGVANADDLIKVPRALDPIAAAVLNINPSTAYRMLKDFVDLEPGDTVLQNGANSAVGQLVIELCKHFKLTTVNIIRDAKPDEQQVKSHLQTLGADQVFTQSEFKTKAKDLFKTVSSPKLALNCVSGRDTLYMMGNLAPNAVLVTYGGMSKEPLQLPTGAFIFKHVKCCGFWISGWNNDPSNHSERMRTTARLTSLFIEGKLHVPPHKVVRFEDYHKAIEDTIGGCEKRIFKF